jgi:hypothetical protein
LVFVLAIIAAGEFGGAHLFFAAKFPLCLDA